MQARKLPRNMHLVPNMSKMDQPLSLKQISQTNKKVNRKYKFGGVRYDNVSKSKTSCPVAI